MDQSIILSNSLLRLYEHLPDTMIYGKVFNHERNESCSKFQGIEEQRIWLMRGFGKCLKLLLISNYIFVKRIFAKFICNCNYMYYRIRKVSKNIYINILGYDGESIMGQRWVCKNYKWWIHPVEQKSFTVQDGDTKSEKIWDSLGLDNYIYFYSL